MKRLPSQIASLRHLLDDELRVELIAEPLFAVDAEDDGQEVAAKLTKEHFDECGLRRNGLIREFIRSSELKLGSAGSQAALIPLERIVAPTTPLWTCMNRLPSNGPLYVLGDHGLSDIVTVADLNKQPARLLMFGVVSMLEMVLLHILKATYPDGSWQKHLNNGRLEKARVLLDERRRISQEIDLADCLQLCDKVTICLKADEVLKAWDSSKTRAAETFSDLQRIRDDLAHAQSPATDGRWHRISDALRQGREILDRSVTYLQQVGNHGDWGCP